MTGSSPLARGLRARVHPRHRPPQDHPRSRGVYSSAEVKTSSPCGSSPLARGLHSERLRRGAHVRIIPARAGFMAIVVSSIRTPTDHPRSRGVYETEKIPAILSLGSSPLARGLPAWEAFLAVKAGIIPARAGFTLHGPHPRRTRRDHPRSRGVYADAWIIHAAWAGSSPLARGLRCDPDSRCPRRTDHPRSRGVYSSTPSRR